MLNQRGWPQSWLNWIWEKSLSAHQPISQTWGSHGWTPRQLEAPMDKYSKETLKAMALEVQKARDEGDERYFVFSMWIQVATGCNQEFLDSKIEEYANY